MSLAVVNLRQTDDIRKMIKLLADVLTTFPAATR